MRCLTSVLAAKRWGAAMPRSPLRNGLVVFQALMASMNGRIGAHSESYCESVFRVNLELAQALRHDSAAPLEQPTLADAGTMEQTLW